MFKADFGFGSDAKSVLDALGKSLAIIEFEPTGTIITANENFCKAMGYDVTEIKGKHHSMFVDPDYASSQDYKNFWADLGRGKFDAREYRRIAKGGKEIWIQASYNPVLTSAGSVRKVVKVATDITAQKLKATEDAGKIEAISRAQAVIEFTPEGRILTANENFLKTLGYALNEIQGQHHRMFVDPNYASSTDYQDFWGRLKRGDYIAQEFKRFGKGGKEVWIQASYNPIFDPNNRVIKVIKYATDTSDVAALNEIAVGLSRLADGDLQYSLDNPFPPKLEKLRKDFNNSVQALHSAMARVGESALAISTGASEVSVSSDNMSKRTEQQAANLEETAAALEQITVTVKKTAESTLHAREVVGTAKADAEKSGDVVQQAVAAMGEIESSSAQITQIISVIDEIAFQTNLLALNAGVEAARAGDAGRGFAVVASEVRALAQRSAEAAKEIKALIVKSTAHVASGVSLVGETGKSLTRIVKQVTDIAGVVAEIAASAREQATGLEEVNTAVSQMDQITQQNAAMVEESTAASHSLNLEAGKLSEQIGQFKLDRNSVTALPVASGQRTPRPAARPAASQPRPALRTVASGRSAAALKADASPNAWEDF